MVGSRLMSLLKKSKTLIPKFPSSNPRESKTFSASFSEPQSSFHSSFPRFIPASEHPIARSFFGYGRRSLLHACRKNFHKPSVRNFYTAKPGLANSTEGLKLLVTAGPMAQEAVGVWLFVSAAWVYSMVVLGGVMRLTKSGLSMTDWKFNSRFPTLSDDDWSVEFEKYKQSLEYRRTNEGMSMDDFKFMYWMEYAHRLWGGTFGVMFAVPFSYFLLKGYITRRLGLRLSGLFAIGAGQGLIGWLTVKSGLEDPLSEYAEPRVSLFRLAAHLSSACIVYSGLFHTALSVVMPEPSAESVAWVQGAAKVKRLLVPACILAGITALSGAYVAGNEIGPAFNTPETGDTQNFFENISSLQLVHGLLATASLLTVGGLWWSTRKLNIHPELRPLIGSTIGIATVQVALGTSSVVSYVPISLGSAHQGGVLTLLTLIIILTHIVRRPSLQSLKTLSSAAKTPF